MDISDSFHEAHGSYLWLVDNVDFVDIFMLLSMPCKPGKHISTCIIHVNVFDIHLYVCV